MPISSYLNGLYLSGVVSGYYCGGAPGLDALHRHRRPTSPRTRPSSTPASRSRREASTALKGIYRYNGGYPLRFVKGASTPAPLLIESGWTDELFPPEQALRVYAYLRSRNRRAPVALQLGDLGHSRGSNKPGLNHYFNDQAAQFFAAHLLGAKKGNAGAGLGHRLHPDLPARERPTAAPSGPRAGARCTPAPSSFGSGAAQEFTSAGGDPAVANAFDPIFGTSEACKTIPVTAEANTATYSRPVRQRLHAARPADGRGRRSPAPASTARSTPASGTSPRKAPSCWSAAASTP